MCVLGEGIRGGGGAVLGGWVGGENVSAGENDLVKRQNE